MVSSKETLATLPRNQLEKKLSTVSKKITASGTELCESLKRSSCDFTFAIDESDKGPNAHADGKRIVITPSMMMMAHDDATLAFILSHEYAHNALAHVNASKQNSLLGSAIGLVIEGALLTQGISMNGDLARMGGSIGSGSYSVEFEREADYLGLYIAARAGYNIERAPDLWRRMSMQNPDAIYLSTTHPSNAERFVGMHKAIEEIKAKQKAQASLFPNMIAQN